MSEDPERLQKYAREGNQDAFSELVRRHLRLVYFSALRQLGKDSEAAADVAQAVFIDLSRKAGMLHGHPSLVGWLYTSVHFACRKHLRTERRRKAREREAFAMQEAEMNSSPHLDWARIQPEIDAALRRLDSRDRDAILMRYFEDRPFAEIAAVQRMSEEAARMRVCRALEKIRRMLARRGVTSTAGALAGAFGAQVAEAAPLGLHARLVASAAAAPAAGGLGLAGQALMATAQSKFAAGIVLVLGLALVVGQRERSLRLQSELTEADREAVQVASLKRENMAMMAAMSATTGVVTTPSAPIARPIRGVASLESNPELGPSPGGLRGPSATIGFTQGGAVMWAGEPLTLREFLDRLTAFHKQHPEPEAALVLDMPRGQPGGAVGYVFEQAQRAGIQHVRFTPDSHPAFPPESP